MLTSMYERKQIGKHFKFSLLLFKFHQTFVDINGSGKYFYAFCFHWSRVHILWFSYMCVSESYWACSVCLIPEDGS